MDILLNNNLIMTIKIFNLNPQNILHLTKCEQHFAYFAKLYIIINVI